MYITSSIVISASLPPPSKKTRSVRHADNIHTTRIRFVHFHVLYTTVHSLCQTHKHVHSHSHLDRRHTLIQGTYFFCSSGLRKKDESALHSPPPLPSPASPFASKHPSLPFPRMPLCRIPHRMIGVAQLTSATHTKKNVLGSVPMARVARSRRWCALASRSCSGFRWLLFLSEGEMLHASRRKMVHGVFPCPVSGSVSMKEGGGWGRGLVLEWDPYMPRLWQRER